MKKKARIKELEGSLSSAEFALDCSEAARKHDRLLAREREEACQRSMLRALFENNDLPRARIVTETEGKGLAVNGKTTIEILGVPVAELPVRSIGYKQAARDIGTIEIELFLRNAKMETFDGIRKASAEL